MKKRIIRLAECLFIVIIAFELVFGAGVFAKESFKVFNAQDSKKEIILNENNVMMLKQEWYGLRFEIDTSQIYKNKKVKAVNYKEYEKALNEVNFDLSSLGDYKVYFLDYRLKNYLKANALSFTDNTAVVFGTQKRLGKEDIHELAVHELGHQVDFRLMTPQKWDEYKALRGITNENIYNNNAKKHYNRPQEIFAEDFRVILGGETAKQILHENMDLEDPNDNLELVRFFKNLGK